MLHQLSTLLFSLSYLSSFICLSTLSLRYILSSLVYSKERNDREMKDDRESIERNYSKERIGEKFYLGVFSVQFVSI